MNQLRSNFHCQFVRIVFKLNTHRDEIAYLVHAALEVAEHKLPARRVVREVAQRLQIEAGDWAVFFDQSFDFKPLWAENGSHHIVDLVHFKSRGTRSGSGPAHPRKSQTLEGLGVRV